MIENVIELYQKVQAFEKEAHKILGRHETAPSRIILLGETYTKLSGLSLQQDELFRQALRCIENGLFRAAHVMAWAGFMDLLEEKLALDGFKKLKSVRPKWSVACIEDLREHIPEYQLIESCQDMGLCTKKEKKALLGLLNKRNECAHPGDYFPGLNESLGFISELFQRINALKGKPL